MTKSSKASQGYTINCNVCNTERGSQYRDIHGTSDLIND